MSQKYVYCINFGKQKRIEMKAIILEGNNSSDIRLLVELAKKLNIRAKILSSEDKEDIALANAILQEESGEYLTEEELINKLEE
jgi:hypothetical protein